MTKLCPKCQKHKEYSEFYNNSQSGVKAAILGLITDSPCKCEVLV